MVPLLLRIIIFFMALFTLVKGSELFVKSAAKIARKLGVSGFHIGLTLVALGTSLPELSSAVAAAFRGSPGIIVGNVVGSNIANIGIVIGLAAFLWPIRTREPMLRRDGYIMLFALALFIFFISNQVISRAEAFVLLFLYMVYMLFLLEDRPNDRKFHFRQFVEYFLKLHYIRTIHRHLAGKNTAEWKRTPEVITAMELGIMAFSGVGIFYGSKHLIESALFFTGFLGVPASSIGVTIIALGTVLPELSITLSAARKGFGNIALGNIIGSNITNIFLVAGVGGLILPLEISSLILIIAAPFLLIITLVLLLFIRTEWAIRKNEGAMFMALYFLFISILVIWTFHHY